MKQPIADEGSPVYSRPARGSATDAFELAIRDLLRQGPRMLSMVIMETGGGGSGVRVCSSTGSRNCGRFRATGSGVADGVPGLLTGH